MRALFDTNVLIDYLAGIEEARAELERFEARCVSLVTWMELLVGARTSEEAAAIRTFMTRFEIVGIDLAVAEKAVELRRQWKLRLPDAIIWASAEQVDAVLITRNSRDFPVGHPAIRVPYQR